LSYYKLLDPRNGNETTYWQYAQAFDALLDIVEFNVSFSPWIEKFIVGQDQIGWNRDYFDDENWMSLALLRAYDLLTDDRLKKFCFTTVIQLWTDIASAWDETCCLKNDGGGIWWDRNKSQKATASNFGPVILSARLYNHTQNTTYLNFASKVFAYWFLTMANQTSGAVCDHINSNGEQQCWKFTYNEGLLVGAAVELYKQTHNRNYLNIAQTTAMYMLQNETEESKFGGLLLTDGKDCSGDCFSFKSIGLRYLFELYLLLTEELKEGDMNIRGYTTTEWKNMKELVEDLKDLIFACAEAAWLNRNAADTTFSADWNDSPPKPPYFQACQTSAIMALAFDSKM